MRNVIKIEDGYLMSDPIADVQVNEMIFEVIPVVLMPMTVKVRKVLVNNQSIAVSSNVDSDPLDL